jgi:RNA polymerase sigma-70 factor (ECF subfamily)
MNPVIAITAPELPANQQLTAARHGCPVALEQLVTQYRPVLLAVAAGALDRNLQSKADAADIVQDTLLEAHCTFVTFRGQQSEEFLAWLRQILIHNLVNFRRKYRETEMRNIRREVELPTSSPVAVPGDLLASDSVFPVEKAANREELTRLGRALEGLPMAYRRVIVWRQWENQSFEEIGQRLDRSAEGARQMWWRGVQLLRKELMRNV